MKGMVVNMTKFSFTVPNQILYIYIFIGFKTSSDVVRSLTSTPDDYKCMNFQFTKFNLQMAYLKQLRLVLWKNSLIRKRHWVLTLFEILLPILLFILVSYSRSKISGIAKQEIVDPTYSEPIHMSEKGEIYYTVIDISSTLFFYCPSNNFTDELIQRLKVKLQVHSNGNIIV